jgi:hypothetical protein
MLFKKFIKETFERGNVCVVGLRGRGKDMLMSNVADRRKKPYICNTDYHCKNDKSVYIPLKLSEFDINNNFIDFVRGQLRYYKHIYNDGTDIYVPDCGVYFPSQYNGELNKRFPSFPIFMALSRQLGQCNVHTNCQNLNRVWDKIREQSDIYVMCEKIKVVGRLVFQIVTIYDNADACQNRVKPFKPLKLPIFNKDNQRTIVKAKNEELKRSFEERNGTVKRRLLVYVNHTDYDTRVFKTMLEGGQIDEKST